MRNSFRSAPVHREDSQPVCSFYHHCILLLIRIFDHLWCVFLEAGGKKRNPLAGRVFIFQKYFRKYVPEIRKNYRMYWVL